LNINPDDVDVWYNKGTALVKLKKCRKALDAFDKVLRLNPDDKKA
jgi:cytochrome c-type biogenesis protein CcmH/NrfG